MSHGNNVCTTLASKLYSSVVQVQQMRCSVKCTIIELAGKDVRS